MLRWGPALLGLSRRARRVKDRGIVVGPEDDIGQWCVGLHRADGVLERDRAGDRVAPASDDHRLQVRARPARCSPMRSPARGRRSPPCCPSRRGRTSTPTRPPRAGVARPPAGCGSTPERDAPLREVAHGDRHPIARSDTVVFDEASGERCGGRGVISERDPIERTGDGAWRLGVVDEELDISVGAAEVEQLAQSVERSSTLARSRRRRRRPPFRTSHQVRSGQQ